MLTSLVILSMAPGLYVAQCSGFFFFRLVTQPSKTEWRFKMRIVSGKEVGTRGKSFRKRGGCIKPTRGTGGPEDRSFS